MSLRSRPSKTPTNSLVLFFFSAYYCTAIPRLYSYGEYKAEDQEQMLEQLDKKVTEVYTKCIGANDANIP